MTRHKTLQCVHEPFGDAYYFGPERLAERYESDPEARKESGYSGSTYRTIFDRIAKENSEVCVCISQSRISILVPDVFGLSLFFRDLPFTVLGKCSYSLKTYIMCRQYR